MESDALLPEVRREREAVRRDVTETLGFRFEEVLRRLAVLEQEAAALRKQAAAIRATAEHYERLEGTDE